MNTYRFNRLVVSVFGGVLLASMLLLWASVLPSSAQARLPASSVIVPITHPCSLARSSYTPAITFTPAFTLYLPAVTKNPGIPANPCAPNQTITDPANDVSPAYIDVTALSTVLNGESLQATFHIRDVPSQLTFNRVGVPKDYLEYEWSVYVDVDNNPQTGIGYGQDKGAEYSLSVMHFVSQPDSPVTRPIADGVQVNTWRYDSTDNSWRYLASAALNVDPQLDTMVLTGSIPGINSGSRLTFETYDWNPGGAHQMDTSSCGVTTGLELQHIEISIHQEADEIVQHWDLVQER